MASGAQKKIKNLPKLSLSAFAPPDSGTSDSFPMPPSPSSVAPAALVDAAVVVSSSDLSQWKVEAGEELVGKTAGVVLWVDKETAQDLADKVEPTIAGIPILSLSVPFSVKDGAPVGIPSSSKVPITLSTVFSHPTQEFSDSLKWAMEQGRVVDVDVQFDNDENSYDALEDTLSAATEGAKESSAIVLSNILPPADDLSLPLFSLLNHPTFRAYQNHTASLSLIANTYVKFIPPSWQEVTPPTPAPKLPDQPESLEKTEWKRRIKLYVGPAVEAFGYQRIIFGSSPSVNSGEKSTVWDWYQLARESFVELGITQEEIDAVFVENAKAVYGGKKA